MKVVRHVSRAAFKDWLGRKLIRPASLEDVWGTHHDRSIWAHPNTGGPYVSINDAAEAAIKESTK